MTIQANTVEYSYVGDGATKAFAFKSRFLKTTDIKVAVNEVLQLTSAYTITGTGNASGGTVTFKTAPAVGARIVLVRNPPISQFTDWVNNTTVFEKSLDDSADRMTMVDQFLQRAINRGLRIPDFARDGFSSFDGRGNQIVAVGPGTTPTNAATYGQLEAVRDALLGTAPQNAQIIPTVLAAMLLNIDTDIDWISVQGHSSVGDGGAAYYERSATEPTHGGKFQDDSNSWWELKATIVTPEMFGAIGDGAAMDTAALQKAAEYPYALGIQLKPGATYRVHQTIPLRPGCDMDARGAFIDASGLPATGFNGADPVKGQFKGDPGTGVLFTIQGTLGEWRDLTSTAAKGASTVTMTSAISDLAADDLVWLRTTYVYYETQSGATKNTFGEILRVKEVDGANVTFYENLPHEFPIGYVPYLQKINMGASTTIRGLRAIGSGQTLQQAQVGIYARAIEGLLILESDLRYFDRSSIKLNTTLDANIVNNTLGWCRLPGLSYGVEIAEGCKSTNVLGNYGEDTRHLITHGGSNGTNRGSTIYGNRALNQREAGIDCHINADDTVIDGNIVELAAGAEDDADGIICQSGSAIITDNIVKGASRYGVYHQSFFNPPGGTVNSIVSNNLISGVNRAWAGTRSAILVTTRNPQTTGLTFASHIEGNIIDGTEYDRAIEVIPQDRAMTVITIRGNSTIRPAKTRGITVEPDGAVGVGRISIKDNDVEVLDTSTFSVVELIADAGAPFELIDITGNTLVGAAFGSRFDNCVRGQVGANTAYSTRAGHRGYRRDNSDGVLIIPGMDNTLKLIVASADWPEIAAGAVATADYGLYDCDFGDLVSVVFHANPQGVTFTAWVQSTDTIRVQARNNTGAPVNLAAAKMTIQRTKI